MEVTNRFKGLDLVDRGSEELCMEVCNTCSQPCIGGSDNNHPQEKEIQEGKLVVWGGLTNSWEKKRSERQRRKGTVYTSECRVPEIRRDPKAFLSEQCKEIEENNRMGKTRNIFKKIRDTKGKFPAKMCMIKDRNRS